jgi:hypothetical protein
MTGWTADELEEIEATDELEIASLRSDGTLGSKRTIWVVRVDDDLYVRSVNGRTSDWFRGTQRRHQGRIQAGGVEKDVRFVEADADLEPRIDEAYRQKYRRYAKRIVDSTLTPRARSAALKLVRRTSVRPKHGRFASRTRTAGARSSASSTWSLSPPSRR